MVLLKENRGVIMNNFDYPEDNLDSEVDVNKKNQDVYYEVKG